MRPCITTPHSCWWTPASRLFHLGPLPISQLCLCHWFKPSISAQLSQSFTETVLRSPEAYMPPALKGEKQILKTWWNFAYKKCFLPPVCLQVAPPRIISWPQVRFGLFKCSYVCKHTCVWLFRMYFCEVDPVTIFPELLHCILPWRRPSSLNIHTLACGGCFPPEFKI